MVEMKIISSKVNGEWWGTPLRLQWDVVTAEAIGLRLFFFFFFFFFLPFSPSEERGRGRRHGNLFMVSLCPMFLFVSLDWYFFSFSTPPPPNYNVMGQASQARHIEAKRPPAASFRHLVEKCDSEGVSWNMGATKQNVRMEREGILNAVLRLMWFWGIKLEYRAELCVVSVSLSLCVYVCLCLCAPLPSHLAIPPSVASCSM